MSTVFTKILAGEIPGRFIHRDDRAAAFLTIAPINPGHVLVVPVEEVDHWDDLDPELGAYVFQLAQRVAKAIKQVYDPVRVALLIAGLEVPHAHLHVIPIDSEAELTFSRARSDVPAAELDEVQHRLAAAFR
ncbi:MAG: family hydrolase [Frankiales bacterium]|nr:family hydrolase [Frankiales bacterium]